MKRQGINLERKITFRLDDDRLSELEAYARREGATVSFVVRRPVIGFLEQRRLGPGRS